MSLTDDLAEAMTGFETDVERADAVRRWLGQHDWHEPSACPECKEDHCPETYVHDIDLDEAIQQLHAAAHADASDCLYAENCRREPCRDVA